MSSNASKPPNGAWVVRTRWLCAYWPVSSVARDGQHCDRETTDWSNVTRSPISARVRCILLQVRDRLVVRLDHDDVRRRGCRARQQRDEQAGERQGLHRGSLTGFARRPSCHRHVNGNGPSTWRTSGNASVRGMHILVLGGDGFCGWPASLHLSAAGHDVAIADSFARRGADDELGAGSLTPIRSLNDRVAAWRGPGGAPIAVHALDVAQDYDELRERSAAAGRRGPAPSNGPRRTRCAPRPQALHGRQQRLLDAQPAGRAGRGRDRRPRRAPRHGGRHPRVGRAPHEALDRELLAFYAANDGLRVTDLGLGIVWGTQTAETLRDDRLANRFDYDGDYGTVVNHFCAQAATGHPLQVHGTGEQTRPVRRARGRGARRGRGGRGPSRPPGWRPSSRPGVGGPPCVRSPSASRPRRGPRSPPWPSPAQAPEHGFVPPGRAYARYEAGACSASTTGTSARSSRWRPTTASASTPAASRPRRAGRPPRCPLEIGAPGERWVRPPRNAVAAVRTNPASSTRQIRPRAPTRSRGSREPDGAREDRSRRPCRPSRGRRIRRGNRHERTYPLPHRENFKRVRKIVAGLVEQHLPQAAAKDHAEHAVEQQVIELRHRPAGFRKLRMRLNTMFSEPPELEESQQIHQAIPADG